MQHENPEKITVPFPSYDDGITRAVMYGQKRLCIFIPSFDNGGVERMLVNLANGCTEQGVAVDLIVNRADGPYLSLLNSGVRVIELDLTHPVRRAFALAQYLRDERPDVLLSAKEQDDRVAVRAKQLAGVNTSVFLRVGTTISTMLAGDTWNPFRRWLRHRAVRELFRRADGIIAVSQGVAQDLAALFGLPSERIHVLPNPVVTSELYRLAEESPGHPWLEDHEIPVILGVGRFSRAKDFPTLIRAFAQVRQRRPARLIILGEGNQKTRLEALAENLGVRADLDLPGFSKNPYAFMARGSLFALSSIREGSPNALTEALALGLPVVATDCPSGPREILQGGRYGRLVPVGDASAMAKAIQDTLDNPPDRDFLKSAISQYTVSTSTRSYLQTLGLKAFDVQANDCSP